MRKCMHGYKIFKETNFQSIQSVQSVQSIQNVQSNQSVHRFQNVQSNQSVHRFQCVQSVQKSKVYKVSKLTKVSIVTKELFNLVDSMSKYASVLTFAMVIGKNLKDWWVCMLIPLQYFKAIYISLYISYTPQSNIQILKRSNVWQNSLSLSLSCLYQGRHGDTHVALNSHLLPPIQRCAHKSSSHSFDLYICACKQGCYHGRHLKPPTHLHIYCLLDICRVELGSVWLYGLRGDMMVPQRGSNSG